MSHDAPIRILIVSASPLMRAGLGAILSRHTELCVVGEAQDAEETTARCRQLQPHIVLMENRLFPAIGLETAHCLGRDRPGAHVILYSLSDTEGDAYQAFQAGVKACLLSDCTPDALVETIRAVHSGETYAPPDVKARLEERSQARAFTPRELEVLHALVNGKSNREIGHTLCIAEGTVKIHINNILLKLNVRDRTQAVVMALMRGIVRVS